MSGRIQTTDRHAANLDRVARSRRLQTVGPYCAVNVNSLAPQLQPWVENG
jgi:hypothetical protein